LEFWNKWKKDYLNTLQQRNKWKIGFQNINKGIIVLLKGENCHPARWPLGKVEEVRKGKDNRVRVVKIKLQDG